MSEHEDEGHRFGYDGMALEERLQNMSEPRLVKYWTQRGMLIEEEQHSAHIYTAVYLAAEVEAVLKEVKELCLELEMDVESAPFHKAASAILARLEETL